MQTYAHSGLNKSLRALGLIEVHYMGRLINLAMIRYGGPCLARYEISLFRNKDALHNTHLTNIKKERKSFDKFIYIYYVKSTELSGQRMHSASPKNWI